MPEYHNHSSLDDPVWWQRRYAEWWVAYGYDALALTRPDDADAFHLAALPTEVDPPLDPEQTIYPETQVTL